MYSGGLNLDQPTAPVEAHMLAVALVRAPEAPDNETRLALLARSRSPRSWS
jgi:hypothetical protein